MSFKETINKFVDNVKEDALPIAIGTAIGLVLGGLAFGITSAIVDIEKTEALEE